MLRSNVYLYKCRRHVTHSYALRRSTSPGHVIPSRSNLIRLWCTCYAYKSNYPPIDGTTIIFIMILVAKQSAERQSNFFPRSCLFIPLYISLSFILFYDVMDVCLHNLLIYICLSTPSIVLNVRPFLPKSFVPILHHRLFKMIPFTC